MPIEKAKIVNLDSNEIIQVMFNPQQITISREVNWREHFQRHLQYPLSEFQGNSAPRMKLSLFFDTYESRQNVHDLFISRLNKFSIFLPELYRPPKLQFVWGTFLFNCIIRKITTRYLLFLPDGTPVRAVSHVVFQEFVEEEVRENTSKENTFLEEIHVVSKGETLPDIASEYYGDSSRWRIIANYNGIQDPVNLIPGVKLRIPMIENK